jgi:hypothetical protein
MKIETVSSEILGHEPYQQTTQNDRLFISPDGRKLVVVTGDGATAYCIDVS